MKFTDGGGHAGHPGRPDHRRPLQHHRLQPQRALLERGAGLWLVHSDRRRQEIHPEHQTQRRCEENRFLEMFVRSENSLLTALFDRSLTSGTNINEALMRAVQMLVRASNQGLIDPRSVSMIILVSDGDPTVGKTV